MYQEDFDEDSPSGAQRKASQSELLIQLTQWYSHPLISGELIEHFLDRGDLPAAVEHHLLYHMYLFTSQPDAFDEDDAGFSQHTDEITTQEERHALHVTALRVLQTYQDSSSIQSVFLPFFDDFWNILLRNGNMHQEMVDVTQILMNTSNEVNHLWFSHAWALSCLERNDEAEKSYRHYLESYPDNAGSLHNLSILVGKKGQFEEALALSNKARALAPDDEGIVKRNDYLTSEQKPRAQVRIVTREGAHQWSLLTNSQKWLLCLMELYPSAHWSELLPYLKKDEQLVRQVQENWDLLLNQGICQLEKGLPVYATAPIRPFVRQEGFWSVLASDIARVQARKKKNLWLPEAADLGDEQLAHASPDQRELIHQALLRQIEHVSQVGLAHVYLHFYRRLWKGLLLQWKDYAALVDFCSVLLDRLSIMTREELWECAYYATDLSDPQYRTLAEKWYKRHLEHGESRVTYHNLSVLSFRAKQYQGALQLIEHAVPT